MISYQEKYLKYKNKYLKLKDLIGGENRFKCIEENRIIDNLCIEDETGDFNDISNCEINCLERKLNEEIDAWRKLFASNPGLDIYCKGGSALGLQVLKMILETDRSKYDDFIELRLIKDWDFTVTMSEEQLERFISKAAELGIVNQSKSKVKVEGEGEVEGEVESEGEDLFVLRFEKGLLLGKDYLLELSIKTTEELHNLELPLTNLKFKVDSGNIELLFDIVKIYVKKQVDLDIILRNLKILLSTITVNGLEKVNTIENGLYTITDSRIISTARLNSILLGIMDSVPYSSGDHINPLTMKQFLITQLCEPDRLFLRFLGKNIIKSQKITRFFQANDIRLPYWLINESILDEINRKILIFLTNLNHYIESRITFEGPKTSKKLLMTFIDEMNILFENVNLARIKLTDSNSQLLKCLVPWIFFQQMKEDTIQTKRSATEAFLRTPKGQQLTPTQQEERRTIFYKYTTSIPTNETKYGQFLKYVMNRL